ncbi:hypothetical protein V2G26_013297 [Clonostachys chloroleuca]
MYLKYPTDLPSATATVQGLPRRPLRLQSRKHVKWDEDIHGKSSDDKGIYTGLEEVLKYLEEKEGYIGSYDDDVLDQMKQHPDTESAEDYLYTWNDTVLGKNELGETIVKDVPLFGNEKVYQEKGGHKEKDMFMSDAEKKARERHRIKEEEWIEWYHWLAVLPLFTCVVS